MRNLGGEWCKKNGIKERGNGEKPRRWDIVTQICNLRYDLGQPETMSCPLGPLGRNPRGFRLNLAAQADSMVAFNTLQMPTLVYRSARVLWLRSLLSQCLLKSRMSN